METEDAIARRPDIRPGALSQRIATEFCQLSKLIASRIQTAGHAICAYEFIPDVWI